MSKTAIIDLNQCLIDCSKPCITVCPRSGEAIYSNSAGDAAIVNSEYCTGCGACVYACQTNAISIVDLDNSEDSDYMDYRSRQYENKKPSSRYLNQKIKDEYDRIYDSEADTMHKIDKMLGIKHH